MFVGLFGIALLTDAAGWKVAVAVFLMIYGDNLSRAVAPKADDDARESARHREAAEASRDELDARLRRWNSSPSHACRGPKRDSGQVVCDVCGAVRITMDTPPKPSAE